MSSEFSKKFIKLLLEQARTTQPQRGSGFVSVGEVLSSNEYLIKKMKDFNEHDQEQFSTND